MHQDSARLGQIAAPGRHVSSSRLQGVPVLAPFPPSGVAAGCPGGPMGGTAPSPGSSAGTRWVIFRVCRCGGKWGRVGPGLGDTFFISFQRPLCQNPSGNAARNRNLGKLRRDLGSPVWVSDKVALAKCVPSHTIGRGRFRPVREEPSEKPSIILWGDEPQDDPPHELAQEHREKPKLVEESWGEKGCAPPSRPYSCRPTARMAH